MVALDTKERALMTDAMAGFDLRDQIAVITGGTGVLGGALASGLCQSGMRIALIGRREEQCVSAADVLCQSGGQAIGVSCDVLDRDQLEHARERIERELGPIDLLVNAAGGNRQMATTSPERTFFDL